MDGWCMIAFVAQATQQKRTELLQLSLNHVESLPPLSITEASRKAWGVTISKLRARPEDNDED